MSLDGTLMLANVSRNGAIGITGVGSYVPQRVVTNDDLSKLVDTSDEWITERTGIRERRVAEPDQAASDLALPAAQQRYGIGVFEGVHASASIRDVRVAPSRQSAACTPPAALERSCK